MTVRVTGDLGPTSGAVDARLQQWEADGFGRRLWEKDPTLWFDPPRDEISNRLGWLDLIEGRRLSAIAALRDELAEEGVTDLVLLGMGGSSLAPEVFQATFGNAPGRPALTVLDSTHPDAVAAVTAATNPATTIYIVASKSGTTLETLSFFRWFWAIAAAELADPGRRFVAITDAGSSLEELAGERSFRAVFHAPPDVGGRYSALTEFGLVPAGAIGVDLDTQIAGAAAAAAQCGPGRPVEQNPGLVLGAALGELALAGRDKVTFLPHPDLAAFPAWIEQLIAESTGKEDTGIVPIVADPVPIAGDDRVFLRLTLGGEGPSAPPGTPVIEVDLADVADLGGAMLIFEIAIAAAGAVLGIHPFDQPDVQLAKELARKAMEGEAFGAGADPIRVDDVALPGTLRAHLDGVTPGDYVGIHAYLAPTAASRAALTRIRTNVAKATGAATTLDFGPRFLHSTGQLHKGGPDSGVFIQIVDDPFPDRSIAETDYTFGRLIAAQAAGDRAALEQRGRRVVSITLGDRGSGGLADLAPLTTDAA